MNRDEAIQDEADREVAVVLEDLVGMLEDSKKGFEKASELLAQDGFHEAAKTMMELSDQRHGFSREIRDVAATHGMSIPADGSVSGTLQRGWMALRDAVSGDSAYGVLAVAEENEDHATETYQHVLKSDLGEMRRIVEAQAVEVGTAHDRVRSLRDAEDQRR